MKNLRTTFALLASALLVLGLFACSPDDPSSPQISGSPIYTPIRVVALGNSLTAGFMNGGLRADGQMAGYANLVANQMTEALTGSARQMTMPLVASPGIGSTPGMTTLYVSSLGAVTSDALTQDPMSLLLAARLPEPYDNLGVPGATTRDVYHATNSTNSQAAGNAYFDAILRNSALPPFNTTQLDQLENLVEVGLPRTLALMLWIGNNDILGGASGGDPVLGVNMTPSSFYQAMLDTVMNRVDDLGIPMKAIANIPSITSAPYFTAIPPQYPGTPGPWNTDESDVALVLLPAQTLVLQADGSPNPDYLPGGGSSLPSTLTLTTAEVTAVGQLVDAYNTIIANEVSTRAAQGWVLVDINAVLDALPKDPTNPATFAVLNGAYPLQPDPGGGGLIHNVNSAFSLDGIHPSEKGYAQTANVFLAAFSSLAGQTFPDVDVSGVANLAGFEQFGPQPALPRSVHFDAAATQVLRDLPRVFGAR